MRVFTAGTAGLLSDLSAREVADSLSDAHGPVLHVDVVTRARYQLTQRGELVHRQVEELLAATDEVREVSTEILAGLRVLEAYAATRMCRSRR